MKLDVDAQLWDPVMRIRGLWYDGLLDPMPVEPGAEPRLPGTVNGGLVLVLGGQQLYGGTSAIEQMFFQTYKYDHVNTFKGAYHINPDYSHWYGWARVLPDVDHDQGRGGAPAQGGHAVRPGVHGDAGAGPRSGGPTTFDAVGLVAWGDAHRTPSRGSSATALRRRRHTGDVVTHKYTAPGRYPVQLTVSDTDLVNDAANPTTCSAMRTTTTRVTVRYAAQGLASRASRA